MRAIAVEQPGGPEALKFMNYPVPESEPGWVVIRVRAFGLNRSEMFTRKGESPGVLFPKVLGLECVGQIYAAPLGEFPPGHKVAAATGGMGRAIDGSYAEFVAVPVEYVTALETDLDWPTLAALPITYLTAWGSLHEALDVQSGQSLLVRGATSSVGMATITLAKELGLVVLATTRNETKAGALSDAGADHVIIDKGEIAGKVREIVPDGVDRAQDLVGTAVLKDTLRATARGGIVCNTGSLADEWTFGDEGPMDWIPSTVKLTTYMGPFDFGQLQGIVDGVAEGRYPAHIHKTFTYDEIIEAHRYLDGNEAIGKLVVVLE